ncbi:MAG TPA: hypothetical protein VF297_04525 [Pyrinomonadaceae bacterium]
MADDFDRPIDLSNEERALVVEKKATCPFIASAVAERQLHVRNSVDDPLASIEEVRLLGNTGGGDLGEFLVLFARGNHARARGASGMLDQLIPGHLFSLDFPGSQGSHPGHSGILQGNPGELNSGRFSAADFERLIERAEDGWIERSEVGRFIAENLIKDPESKVLGRETIEMFGIDLKDFAESVVSHLREKLFGSDEDADAAQREAERRLAGLARNDNLVGSAGEFGLLFAFLAHRPDAKEDAVSVNDLRMMFVDKRLPDGWETWEKKRVDWVTSTTALIFSAGKEYLKLKRAN